MKILLASNSPRRRQILEEAGHSVSVCAPDFDEGSIREEEPCRLVEALAAGKGRSIPPPKDTLLVAADTIVCLEGQILGKPASAGEALAILSALSGRAHSVFTGVYLRYNDAELSFHEETRVHFRPLSKEEILRYIAGGSPFDKAGAYGIQDSDFTERIEGSYTNVVGFPAERFEKEIINIMQRGAV